MDANNSIRTGNGVVGKNARTAALMETLQKARISIFYLVAY